MSKERNIKPEKAIENLRKDLKENIENSNYHYRYLRCLYSNRDIETALNYIDKLQKEIDISSSMISNYDSQLVINQFTNKEDVKIFLEERARFELE